MVSLRPSLRVSLGGQAEAPAGGQESEHCSKHTGLFGIVDDMMALVYDHNTHSAGKLVQLHAV